MGVIGKFLKNSFSVTTQIKGIRKLKPSKWQKKTLIKLLTKARNTEFGQKFKFDDILESAIFDKDNTYYQKYKEIVPIYDYNKIYNEWWHRAYKGESDITWPKK